MLTNKKGNYQRKYKQPFLKAGKTEWWKEREKKQDKNKKQNQFSESASAVHMFIYDNKNLKRQHFTRKCIQTKKQKKTKLYCNHRLPVPVYAVMINNKRSTDRCYDL